MLMQAQEKHTLVNRLINLKCDVDQAKPKDHTHLSQGLVHRRKVEARKINVEN